MFLLKEGGTGLQAKIREERKRFDKDGSLKLVALPAPVASEAPATETATETAPESPATPLAPSLVDGIRNETAQAAQAASEAAQAPIVKAPTVGTINPAQDAHDKAFAIALNHLDRVSEYCTAQTVTDSGERESIAKRLAHIAKLIGVSLA
jgi:hypothetical protein